MSDLAGHERLTAQAVKELATSCSSHPLVRGLSSARLPVAVVARDYLDIFNLGHWLDSGQKRHFQRFDGQSPLEAYRESVQWIRTNVLIAAGILAHRIKWYFPKDERSGVSPYASTRSKCNVPAMSGGREDDRRGYWVFGGDPGGDLGDTRFVPDVAPTWQHLGNAIHALQDSFSEGHVIRGKPLGKGAPGPIEYIKVYGGSDKEGHGEFDKQWEGENNGFSEAGRFAIEGTIDLITMVIATALLRQGSTIISLHGWNAFQGRWFAVSPRLSSVRD